MERKHVLYVGTYGAGTEDTIFRLNISEGSYVPSMEPVCRGIVNPSYLAISADGKRIYAVEETSVFHDSLEGAVASVLLTDGIGQKMEERLTNGKDPCHVLVDERRHFLIAANYSSGSLALFPLSKDGSIGECCDFIQHHGKGENPERQEGSHIHFNVFDPDGRYLYDADLGLDRVYCYSIDEEEKKLVPHPDRDICLPAGSGPRHIYFSRKHRGIMYIICELSGDIFVVDTASSGIPGRDSDSGGNTAAASQNFSILQKISVRRPEDQKNKTYTAAAVKASEDERFIFASDRGTDMVTVFAVKEDGRLKTVEHFASGGKTPRDILAVEDLLLCANQGSDAITCFRFDRNTGRIISKTAQISCPSPACLVRAEDLPASASRPDPAWAAKVQEHWDHVSKPLDSMGIFEKIFDQIGAIQETEKVRTKKKRLLILCADNGVVEEGISQSGQDVTLKVARQMLHDATSVGRMARLAGVDTCTIDIGINAVHTGISPEKFKVRQGTRNFAHERAMTYDETLSAIHSGMELVRLSKEQGYDLVGTGEMGIGNTTTSSAVCAALLHKKAEEVTGRGAGLSDNALKKKIRVIDEAILKYDLYRKDALTVLSSVGGLDIAGMAGICIGGAIYRMPVVLDGVISLTAAMAAERLVPGVRSYLIASHKGKEPACRAIEKELKLHPVIDAGMALGEGTGAVMMMQLLDMAAAVYYGSTFTDSKVEQYTRF